MEELVNIMNKRPGVSAKIATEMEEHYLSAVDAGGSYMLIEDVTSSILLRKDVTRRTALHEWLHRSKQKRS